MKKHAFLALSALFGGGLIAGQAHATTWVGEELVVAVALKSNTNDGGSGQQLKVEFEEAINYCGTVSTTVHINVSDSNLWEHWYETARAALLSGRPLRIGTSNATGTCKAYYVEMK